MTKGAGTFDDMAAHKTKPPLKLFTQHFTFLKPPKYTRPHLKVAHSMSLAAMIVSQTRPNFAKFIFDQMASHAKSSNIKTNPCLYASHMLTRVAYQAVGMIDKLPAPLEQAIPKHKTRPGRGKARLVDDESEPLE